MLTQEELYITDEIYQIAKEAPEVMDLDLEIFTKSPRSNPDMLWVAMTLEEKQFDNINFMVSVSGQKSEFILSLYYHMLFLVQEYRLTGLQRPNAMELAQRDIEELLSVYNQKEIDYEKAKTFFHD